MHYLREARGAFSWDGTATFAKYTGLPADLVPKVMLPHWEKKLLAAELRAMSELCYTLKFTKRKITPEEQVSDLAVVG